MSAAAAREELNKVTTLVLTARRLLAGGTLVDLSAIQERVRLVVEAVTAMPRDEARSLCDEMVAVIGRLDRLGEEMREQLRQLQNHNGGMTGGQGGGQGGGGWNRLRGYANPPGGGET